MPKISRRDLMKISINYLWWISGIIGVGGIIRFLSFEPAPPPPKQFELGPTSNYLIGTRTLIKNIPAVLFRTTQGFHAISLTCQHLGCTVEVKADEFICPCHGSRYNKDGHLLNGPAQRDLPVLRVLVTPDQRIIVFKDE